MASFFIIPAVLEIKDTYNFTMFEGYYDFNNHFVSISQLLLDNYWGYGLSYPGINDGMSFAIGTIQLISIIISFILFLSLIKKKKFKDKMGIYFTTCFFCGIFFIFMTTNYSVFLWNTLKFLKYLQFPFRFFFIFFIFYRTCWFVLGDFH